MSDPSGNQPQLPPVAWLLGRQLIASLKWILLYTAFGTKLDARVGWKRRYPFRRFHGALKMETRCIRGSPREPEFWTKKEFWFDYLSDTGDGTKATYSIAYLCLSNLWTKTYWEATPALKDSYLKLDQFADAQHPAQLPRGEFLLIGGDTSYHLSDYATLHLRFQNPFNWAYDDLTRTSRAVNKKIDDEGSRKNGAIAARSLRSQAITITTRIGRLSQTVSNPVSTRPETRCTQERSSGPQLMLTVLRETSHQVPSVEAPVLTG